LYIHAVFIIRMMSFDLEIFGTLLNGSCRPMREGNVVLSYRIGTSRQWKIIEEYSALGKLVKLLHFKNLHFCLHVCIYKCTVQLHINI